MSIRKRIESCSPENSARLAGDQAFAFIGGGAFGSVAGHLRFEGEILVGDLNVDGVTDFQITLIGVTSLTSANIWL